MTLSRALAAGALAALVLGAGAAPDPRQAREQAYRANNRGVALLEQFRQGEAVEAFREALRLDPSLTLARVNLAIAQVTLPDLAAAEKEARLALAAGPGTPHGQYVLGLALRGLNRTDEAKAAFRAVIAADATDVGAHVNLGQLLLQERAYADAIAEFRAALEQEAHNGTALYNLGLALTRAGQSEESRTTLERFRVLREAGYGSFIGQSYGEQGRYAEAVASTGAEADLLDPAMPAVRYVDGTARLPGGAAAEAGRASAGTAGRVSLLDFDGDGDLDAFEVSAGGQRLLRNDGGRFSDVTVAAGLDGSQPGIGAVAGDVDNDERADLLVLRAAGSTLYRNDAEKGFVDVSSTAGLPRDASGVAAALADFDHDGDLDVWLAGSGAPGRLFRNDGRAVFADAGFPENAARVVAAVPTDYDNGRDIDLLEAAEDGPLRLFRNLRDGRFRDVAAEVGLAPAAKLRCLAAGDVNKDGYTDVFGGADTGDLLALSDGKGRFATAGVPWGSAGTRAAQFLDYDNDGLLDLLALGAQGARLLRNQGSRWVDVTATALGDAARGLAGASPASGDLDGDGDTDLLLRLPGAGLRYLENQGGDRKGSVRVRLAGLVSNRSGVGAKVEMRAGSLHQKLETYAATPMPAPADVVFGLGGRGSADAIRVLWPAGILQTELAEPGADPKLALFDIHELDRKPSSCPYLYAWNGSRFEFVTDFMGGGEIGYFMAPGVWNQPDPVEYVRLGPGQLRPRKGRYELRVTNELEEALFVDRVALVAVAHPADVEVYPLEGMTSPPKPDALVAVGNARLPLAAADGHGHDVLDRLARMDRRYPDDFVRHRIRGYAEPHTLTLDLGAVPQRAALLLTGWTDYAFSSDNVAAHQAGLAMAPPSLEVEDAAGAWVTAIPQVGIPVGRPQTVVVELRGVWKSASRRVRIATNMRIYWDEVRVADVVDAPLEVRRLDASEASLRERGFSAEASPDGRPPFGYDYERVSLVSPWKAFPGRYTRVGDVRELLAASDDAFVISRPGDEIAVAFDTGALPEPTETQRRTLLLFSDGFSKEMDINSATPHAMAPLPFHGMSGYPYAPPERYPMTEERARLMERYNTRVVRVPVPGLVASE
jgi:tetratricopeptide (TPR) repeat protein